VVEKVVLAHPQVAVLAVRAVVLLMLELEAQEILQINLLLAAMALLPLHIRDLMVVMVALEPILVVVVVELLLLVLLVGILQQVMVVMGKRQQLQALQ
jgi:hypothetical protein